MLKSDINDTIAAPATPPGAAGIAIVRISGKNALKIADKVFLPKDNKTPSEYKTYTTHYGWAVDGKEKIDEVILTVMRAPRSYTKEDVVEINCHGGIVALRRVMDLVLVSGCRLAEPGEFTKRAFLNGRIDLAQAEAVLDIIQAKTESALRMAQEQLEGIFSLRIKNLRKDLLEPLSILEANIDFPEEEISPVDLRQIYGALSKGHIELKNMLDNARYGRILREGIHVVICGKPNVGKSSLLNALLRKERSIVTPIAGTTRDTVEEIIDIKGIPVRIVDTAGIIEPKDIIEKEAIRRSKRQLALADLVILVFDGAKALDKDDVVLVKKLSKKQIIAVINKIDIKQNIQRERIFKRFKNVIEVSAKKLKNIDSLEEVMVNLVYGGQLRPPESGLVSNLRHMEALRQAQKLVEEALNSLDNKLSWEFIAQGIKDSLGHLDGILGKHPAQDLWDKIFSRFCIGK